MDFAESEKIDVTGHMEKKGRFTYLSWPFAVSALRKAYPTAFWVVAEYGENKQPYCVTDSGCFVSVTVNIDGLTFTQIHPVLDNANKTVLTPNAFQVNTSIQRCLVKAIALATGIGLHIYAGEDLPPADDEKTKKEEIADQAAYYNDLMVEVDKCTNKAALVKWMKDNKDRVAKMQLEYVKRFGDQCREYMDIFKKEEEEGK